ncbi:MAG: HNH endonuclease [Desulfobacteraceae bacterium]|nr:HNH endonuclease [Desulfobacteraceae bacterium]
MKKLYALKKLGEHIGMYGKMRKIEVEFSLEEVIIIFINYLRNDISIVRKYALALLLDYYLPEWRKIVGPKLLGPIVERDSRTVQLWRKEVIERDGGKCVDCGSKNNLEAHHIISWAEAPELRTDPENGLTQCVDCHSKKHERFRNFIISRRSSK